jgi:hypothetical protein
MKSDENFPTFCSTHTHKSHHNRETNITHNNFYIPIKDKNIKIQI